MNPDIAVAQMTEADREWVRRKKHRMQEGWPK